MYEIYVLVEFVSIVQYVYHTMWCVFRVFMNCVLICRREMRERVDQAAAANIDF